MFTELLLYSILPVLTLTQISNTLLDEESEYYQQLWPYKQNYGHWPKQQSDVAYYVPHLKRWASQLRFGKRTNWVSKVRLG